MMLLNILFPPAPSRNLWSKVTMQFIILPILISPFSTIGFSAGAHRTTVAMARVKFEIGP